MNTDKITALLERVEKATEGSRELDAEIDAELFGGRPSHTFSQITAGARLRRGYDKGTVFISPDPEHNGGNVLRSHYRKAGEHTTSESAAFALVEQALPGWSYSFGKWGPEFRGDLWLPSESAKEWDELKWYWPVNASKRITTSGATIPLAIIASLLKALKDGEA